MTASQEALRELQARLGVSFDNEELLGQALIHRSFAFENGGLEPNERLEFLGDSVLALVVTDEIFHLEAASAEGRLAKIRAAAVKTGSLAAVARQIGVGEFVLLGKGEATSGGAEKESILADTLEAIIGAYYLDGGFWSAYDLVQRLFAERLAELAGSGAALDYKTSLQELAAARFGVLPIYTVTDTGPDHAKTFRAEVRIEGRNLGVGSGRSKKQAEQRAAREAYRELTDEPTTLPPAVVPDGPVGTRGRGETAV